VVERQCGEPLAPAGQEWVGADHERACEKGVADGAEESLKAVSLTAGRWRAERGHHEHL
jgi:hypothetical protein